MWESLSVNGSVLMPLDKYEWSKKYGWCQDRFGINWQVMFVDTISQKIVPSLMFTGDQSGRAEEAIKFYTSVFQDSEIVEISRYTKEESDVEGTVKYGQFRLAGQDFAAMDSSMAPFSFNDGVSLVVNCDTQEEIDLYWDKFTSEGEEGMCGWLKDKFGVSWQIVPSKMSELMSDPDRAKRVTEAFMKMKKLDLAVLESA